MRDDVSEDTDIPHCPQCGYDLRGQTVERCPECGFHYDRPSLRYLARRAAGYCLPLQLDAIPFLFAGLVLSVGAWALSQRWISPWGALIGSLAIQGRGPRVAQGWVFGDRPGLRMPDDFILDGAGRRLVRWVLAVFVAVGCVASLGSRRFGLSVAAALVVIGVCWTVFTTLELRRMREVGQIDSLTAAEARALQRGHRMTCVLAGLDAAALVLHALG